MLRREISRSPAYAVEPARHPVIDVLDEIQMEGIAFVLRQPHQSGITVGHEQVHHVDALAHLAIGIDDGDVVRLRFHRVAGELVTRGADSRRWPRE